MNWMTIRALAAHLKKSNPDTQIGENTIRTLVTIGFPCVRIGNRVLINADTFGDELNTFVVRQSKRPISRSVAGR